MTYKDLLEILSELNEEQLNMDVTVYDSIDDEFFPIDEILTAENDVLDKDHLYFII